MCLAGLGSSLGPGPLHYAPESPAQLGPLPGVVYLSVHTFGPQGVTQPCSPHSSSAMQPVPSSPHQPETGPVLGGGQEQPFSHPVALLAPAICSRVSASLSAFVSEHLSNFVSATINLCRSLFMPQPFSGKVHLFLSVSVS